ncbi:MAG: hypothetical protein R3F56_09135 [Planctomycetota bacterium]
MRIICLTTLPARWLSDMEAAMNNPIPKIVVALALWSGGAGWAQKPPEAAPEQRTDLNDKQRIQQLEQENKELQRSLEKLIRALDAERQRNESLHLQLEALQAENKELRQELDGLQQRQTKTEEDFKQYEKAARTKIEALEVRTKQADEMFKTINSTLVDQRYEVEESYIEDVVRHERRTMTSETAYASNGSPEHDARSLQVPEGWNAVGQPSVEILTRNVDDKTRHRVEWANPRNVTLHVYANHRSLFAARPWLGARMSLAIERTFVEKVPKTRKVVKTRKVPFGTLNETMTKAGNGN